MTPVVAQPLPRETSALERSLLAACRAMDGTWPEWLAAQQSASTRWLQDHGLTKSRDEGWKYASIAPLLAESVLRPAARGTAKALGSWLGLPAPGETPILWLVNGVAMTDAPSVPGIRWLPLAEAIRQEPKVSAHLGSHVQLENGFVAANNAGFLDGWCLIVDAGATIDIPIELRILESTEGNAALSLPRVLVIAGAGSRIQLVERHWSQTGDTLLSSAVMELVLEAGAHVEHCRRVEHGPKTWAMAATAVSVGDNAEYYSWSATASGRFVRHDLAVRLAGRAAKAVLDGLYYANDGEVVAQHARVWHERPDGVTRECYRGVVGNGGRGVFDGIIYVGRDAKRTDARQENRNLLLGPRAIANTKPHLEIDTDDVACSHGATVGQLDEQQLFYLRSRGINEGTARAVLTWAFAKEIVDRCPNASLRSELENGFESRQGVLAQPGLETTA